VWHQSPLLVDTIVYYMVSIRVYITNESPVTRSKSTV
jgi:hypothetical protein